MTPDILASIAKGMILPFTENGKYVDRSGLRLEAGWESELEVWMLSLWYIEDVQVEILSKNLKREV